MVKGVTLVKDLALARSIGPSAELDTMIVVSTLILAGISIGPAALAAAVIPVSERLRSQQGQASALAFNRMVLASVTLLLSLVTALLMLGATPILTAYVPRLATGSLPLLRTVFWILGPMLVFSGLSALLGALLQAEGQFGPVAWATVCGPALTILALAWGTGPFLRVPVGLLLGVILELGLLAIWYRHGWGPLSVHDRGLRTALAEANQHYLPVLAGGVLMTSTTLVDVFMAARLPPGTTTVVNLASRLPNGFSTLAMAALGSAALPLFSRLVAEGRIRELRHTLLHFVCRILGIGIPVAVLLALASPWIARLAFAHGHTHLDSARLIGRVQAMYFLQLPFYLCSIFLVRAISALQQNRVLLLGAVISAGLNVGLDLLFIRWMGPPGIALSTVVVYFVACLYMAAWVRHFLRINPAREGA